MEQLVFNTLPGASIAQNRPVNGVGNRVAMIPDYISLKFNDGYTLNFERLHRETANVTLTETNNATTPSWHRAGGEYTINKNLVDIYNGDSLKKEDIRVNQEGMEDIAFQVLEVALLSLKNGTVAQP